MNIHISAFQNHAKSDEHKRLKWAHKCGKHTMEKDVVEVIQTCDEVMHYYFLSNILHKKKTIPFDKFLGLCILLPSVKMNIIEFVS